MPSSGVQTCALDRKSTRLNSSHTIISYAVFCLKKKNLHLHAVTRRQSTAHSASAPPHTTCASVAVWCVLCTCTRYSSPLCCFFFFFFLKSRPPPQTPPLPPPPPFFF